MQRHREVESGHAHERRIRSSGWVSTSSSRIGSISGQRVRLYSLVLALAAALLSLVVWVVFTAGGRLHEAPVSVVAAPVLVTSLRDDLGSEIIIDQTVDEAAAVRHLDLGISRAVLVVDLSTTDDILVIPAGQNTRAVTTLVSRLRSAEALRGRSLDVRVRQIPANTRLARDLTSAALVAGFVLAALMSMGVGRRAHRIHRTVRRAGIAVVAFVAIAVGVAEGWVAALWLTLAMAMAVLLTLALEALLGWIGFAVSAALCLIAVWPSVLAADPVFLPAWMQWIWHWSPPGSAAAAVMSAMLFGAPALVHHALQMGAWILAGVLALGLARRLPRRIDGGASVGRRKVGVVVVFFTAMALAAIALTPDAVVARPNPQLPENRLSDCAPIPEVDSVADLNRITRLPATSEFAGADVGVDVGLQDGRRLWLFADTLREGAGMVRNSMLVSEDRCLRAVVPDQGGAVIPNRPRSLVGYWPMSVVRISMPGYDVVPVWAQRVRRSGTGAFGFETLGPSVAVFVVRPDGVPQLVAVKDLLPDRADVSRPMWGAAAVADGEWVYLYGTANRGDTLGFSVSVARVRSDRVLDPDAIQYWDGFDWSSAAGSAAEVIPGAGGTSQTFSVLHRGDLWYAVSKQDEFLGSYVRVWMAASPTGPFYEGPVLAVLPSELHAGHLVYMVLAHPEVLPDRDSMVLSYSRNDINMQHIVDHPIQYRPRFLRVWFP